jgi:hypothetical protein
MLRPSLCAALSLTLTTLGAAGFAAAAPPPATGAPAVGSSVSIDMDADGKGGASFTVPSSSTKGSVVAASVRGNIVQTWPAHEYDFQGGCSKGIPVDQFQGGCQRSGDGWATFPADDELVLVHVADMGGADPLTGTVVAVAPAGDAFRPDTMRVGIIAILIGLVVQRLPAVVFQDGDDVVLRLYDGTNLTELARRPAARLPSPSVFEDLVAGF